MTAKPKNSKLKEWRVPENPSKMTPEKIEALRNRCDRHSTETMASVLNIGVRSIQRYIQDMLKEQMKSDSINLQKYDGNCHFCSYNEKVLNLSDDMIESLKDKCSNHRMSTLIKHTNLDEIVIKRWLKESKKKFPKVTIYSIGKIQ